MVSTKLKETFFLGVRSKDPVDCPVQIQLENNKANQNIYSIEQEGRRLIKVQITHHKHNLALVREALIAVTCWVVILNCLVLSVISIC